MRAYLIFILSFLISFSGLTGIALQFVLVPLLQTDKQSVKAEAGELPNVASRHLEVRARSFYATESVCVKAKRHIVLQGVDVLRERYF